MSGRALFLSTLPPPASVSPVISSELAVVPEIQSSHCLCVVSSHCAVLHSLKHTLNANFYVLIRNFLPAVDVW